MVLNLLKVLRETMYINKNIFILLLLVFLNSCMQSSAFLGPAITVVATNNVYQAGLSYGTNRIIKKETGKDAIEHLSTKIEFTNRQKEKIDEDFIVLVENNILMTRKKLFFDKN